MGARTARRIGEVTDTGRPSLLPRRRAGRRDPRALPHRRGAALPRRAVAARGRAGAAGAGRAARRERAARAARLAEHPLAGAGSTSATTTSSARGRCAGPGSTRRCCGCGRRCAGWRLSLDGPGRVARAAPRTGGALAVLEAARNVACAGGEPIGLTDCLNFGNPEKPEIAWELAEAIEGMARAAEALRIPVVSGNVSLYNETDGRAILPAPVVGCVGLVPDVTAVPGRWREGDVVLLASAPKLSSRSRGRSTRRSTASSAAPRPRLDLGAERALVEFLWRVGAGPLARARRVRRRARGRARPGGPLERRRSGGRAAATTCSPGSARAAARR